MFDKERIGLGARAVHAETTVLVAYLHTHSIRAEVVLPSPSARHTLMQTCGFVQTMGALGFLYNA